MVTGPCSALSQRPTASTWPTCSTRFWLSTPPWWTHFRIEAVGFTPHTSKATVGAHTAALDRTDLGYAITFPDTGRPQSITLN